MGLFAALVLAIVAEKASDLVIAKGKEMVKGLLHTTAEALEKASQGIDYNGSVSHFDDLDSGPKDMIRLYLTKLFDVTNDIPKDLDLNSNPKLADVIFYIQEQYRLYASQGQHLIGLLNEIAADKGLPIISINNFGSYTDYQVKQLFTNTPDSFLNEQLKPYAAKMDKMHPEDQGMRVSRSGAYTPTFNPDPPLRTEFVEKAKLFCNAQPLLRPIPPRVSGLGSAMFTIGGMVDRIIGNPIWGAVFIPTEGATSDPATWPELTGDKFFNSANTDENITTTTGISQANLDAARLLSSSQMYTRFSRLSQSILAGDDAVGEVGNVASAPKNEIHLPRIGEIDYRFSIPTEGSFVNGFGIMLENGDAAYNTSGVSENVKTVDAMLIYLQDDKAYYRTLTTEEKEKGEFQFAPSSSDFKLVMFYHTYTMPKFDNTDFSRLWINPQTVIQIDPLKMVTHVREPLFGTAMMRSIKGTRLSWYNDGWHNVDELEMPSVAAPTWIDVAGRIQVPPSNVLAATTVEYHFDDLIASRVAELGTLYEQAKREAGDQAVTLPVMFDTVGNWLKLTSADCRKAHDAMILFLVQAINEFS
jgi:hypothetical protein